MSTFKFSISCRRLRHPLNHGTQKNDGPSWDGAHGERECEYSPSAFSESTDIGLHADGDLTLTASSSSTAPGCTSRFWHSSTPHVYDATDTG